MNNDGFYQGKRVLVTGGLGFIGSNLAIRLAGLGAKVTLVDSAIPGCGANHFNIAPIATDVDLIERDIGEAEYFSSILGECAVVFNLAGEISHSRSMTEPERDLALNTTSQLRFLLACRAHRRGVRVVYAGTRQVYGKPEYLPVDEDHPIEPVDFNGVHKHAAAQYHLLLSRRGELDCAVLRLSNVYGPRMALALPQQGFLGVYLQRALQGEPLTVYGDGAQLRDPIHVDDVVDAFLAAGRCTHLPARVYNIGGDHPRSLKEMAEIISGQGRGGSIRQVPFPEHLREIDIGSYVSNTSRLKRDLSVVARVDFIEGIRETLAYYRGCENRYLPDVALVRVAPAAGKLVVVSAQ